MAYELKNFLYNFIVRDDSEIQELTHVSLEGGKYNIPEEENDKLFELISKYAFKEKITLAECPPKNSVTQLKIDLDFQFNSNTKIRKYDLAFKRDFIEIYNQIIMRYLNVPESENEKLHAFVFERETPYTKNGMDKDGIHIMYPHLVCDVKIQEIIRKDALVECGTLLSKLECCNEIRDIIDLRIIKKNAWLMYGSSKRDTLPYKLSNVIDSNMSDLSIKQYTSNMKNLVKLLSTRGHDETKSIQIRQEYEQLLIEHVEKDVRKDLKKKDIFTRAIRKSTILNKDDDLEEIKKLIDILSQERADNSNDWINVGLCLSHISNDLYDDFVSFSKKSESFKDEEQCRNLWDKFKEGSLGIGSLHVWAKCDNPVEYYNIMSESIRNIINKSKSKTSQDISRVIYELYKYDYKFVPGDKIGKGTWYEFKNHRWHACNSAITLMQRIGNEVVNEFVKVSVYYQQNALIVNDDNKTDYLKQSEIFLGITYQLRELNKKETFLKECSIMFSDPEFEEKLDSNPDLICFNNGVYDLKLAYFRDGCPDDNLSLCTNIDYVNFEMSHDYVHEIYEFMKQVFPEKEKLEAVMLILSTFLEGRNPLESFYLLSGTGGNGKSKLIQLLEKSLGGYASRVPTALFTKTTGTASSANPEIARLRGIRFISAQETEEKDSFNIAMVKNLTGNEKLTARFLNKNFFEFFPQFKIAFSCNHRPTLPADDGGIWRRIVNIEFLSRFVDKPDKKNPNEFKRDNKLDEKLELWKEAFMYLLIETYKIYKITSCIVLPKCILDATEEYRRANDCISDFIAEKIMDSDHGGLKLEETYTEFKIWWKNAIDNKPKALKEFKEGMVKRFGLYDSKTGWKNKKLIPSAQKDDQAQCSIDISEEIPLSL